MRLDASSGAFTLTPTTSIQTETAGRAEAAYLAAALRPATGFELPLSEDGEIQLALNAALGEEAYQLEVTGERIRIVGGDRAGLFYGIQTLRQLLPPAVLRGARMTAEWTVPGVEIEDHPRFGWRGMHMDCARYYMPVSFIKQFLDGMALHKLNRFHWHLTEDQGWRLEIQRYPQLTEISAWRKQSMVGHFNNKPRRFDNTRHGGVYSQDDVREIVAYAAARHITVVPEIEMPGHTEAVLAAFPHLGCTGGPYAVRQLWGISKEVFCAGNDRVFEFLEGVLEEVLELFPSEFIHIGGDECPKDRWETCEACQQRIKDEELADTHELQSWFIRRIERFLNERGRRLIGWDEILEGGLAPNASVMSWRGLEGGIKAAELGHDVVFTPNQFTYFDYYQSEDPFNEPVAIGGHLPLEEVYNYDPVPSDFTPEQAAHVLGSQGQLWSEYMPNAQHMQYMAFPRLCALAEVVWTPQAERAYGDFRQRLGGHLPRLDALGIHYRPLDG